MQPGNGGRLRVVGGKVLTPSGWAGSDVVIAQGRIVSLDGRVSGAGDDLDATDCSVVPGFIDLQINGAFGHDFTARPESLWEVSTGLARYGVTAYLPTIISSPRAVVRRALEVLPEPPKTPVGAIPLGLHCEGPMLAPSRRGAHEAAHLRPAGLARIEGWSKPAGVSMVTIAPELEGAPGVIQALLERKVVVAAGHSEATFAQAVAAFDQGISAGTHLFNAMSGIGHREPGLAGALLARDDVPAGLIADGIHVHPAVVATAWRAKGSNGIALVTDAIAALGIGDGNFNLGDRSVEVRDGVARNEEGRLAGSVLSMDRAVRNLVQFTGCSLAEACRAAATTPARIIGATSKGNIEAGADADLVVLDDELNVRATIVGGRVTFDARERQSAR